MASVDELSKKNPDGTRLGQSSTDKIGFFGLTTPIVQPSAITAVGTTASTSSSPVGYGSTTQADAVVTAVNACITALKNLGLTA